MGVIELVFKTRDEFESLALIEKFKLTPQRNGDFLNFQIKSEHQKYIESEEFAQEVGKLKSVAEALDRMRKVQGGGEDSSAKKGRRGKVVRMTDEMMQTLKECKNQGENAADAQRKIEAVHGVAPGYQTVLNYYNKL